MRSQAPSRSHDRHTGPVCSRHCPPRSRRPGAAGVLSLALAACVSCSRSEPADSPTLALGVDVRADSGGQLLEVNPPPAKVWVARVGPVRPSAALLEPGLPEAPLDTLIPTSPPPPLLLIDDDLKPPIPRKMYPLYVPASHARQRWVESVALDVRVDEAGEVTDALWAGGSNDAVLVQAATECALRMKFYPALQAGRPVPVWCRQRFDFGAGASTPALEP